jgi:hypothetical protein
MALYQITKPTMGLIGVGNCGQKRSLMVSAGQWVRLNEWIPEGVSRVTTAARGGHQAIRDHHESFSCSHRSAGSCGREGPWVIFSLSFEGEELSQLSRRDFGITSDRVKMFWRVGMLSL